MSVILRQRKKGKKISLYLDFYENSQRWTEALKLYLTPEPENGRLTPKQKDENKKNLELAESIRSKRHLEIQNGLYGFHDKEKLKGSFINYFNSLMKNRSDSDGNYGNWKSTLLHIKEYEKGDVSFHQVNKEWLEGFKEYLNKKAKTKSKKPLSVNTKFSYFSKVVAALKQAVKDGILVKNPALGIEAMKQGETHKEFLSFEELEAAYNAECDNQMLKTAFIFSALTGLRWSDILKLKWKEILYSKENGYMIRFEQEKTEGKEYLPISQDARNLLGDEGSPNDNVFRGLSYSAWNNLKLREWLMRAGINRHITFHSARHTFATLQLTFGTDIYTVSKLLGHKNLKNTEIYAKIVNEKKRDAVNKISIGIKK
jgi:integrase